MISGSLPAYAVAFDAEAMDINVARDQVITLLSSLNYF